MPIDVRGATVAYDGGAPVLRDVDLSVAAGRIVSLLGPSGCGKTTLLRAVAGLEQLLAGEIAVGERVVSSPRAHLAAQERQVGMVFQDWALFPHLTVLENVQYGLPRSQRSGGMATNVLASVGLVGFDDRLPHTLSGGQQQRVALARALAPGPSVLLLDEPFSNLDTSLRVEVRTEVHRLLNELDITTIFVTHDQDEAFVLGDEVAVMKDGVVAQFGSPAELYSRPVSPWVARFVGEANLLEGFASGDAKAVTAVGEIPLLEPADGRLQVLVRPEDIGLALASTDADTGRPSGPVELVEYYGHDTVYELMLGESPLRVRISAAPRFARGDVVTPTYTGSGAAVFPVDGGSG